jgi:hypothetical protein
MAMIATPAAAVGRMPEITGETAEITPNCCCDPARASADRPAASDAARLEAVEMSALAA